jgi:putative heme iron utilization protein
VAKDHGDPGDAPTMPPPLTEIADATRPSAAEEARTIAAATNVATLASLTRTGDPWASFVTYGLLDTGSFGGAPVLCVSHLAEHGRNLAADPRASLSIVAPGAATSTAEADPLASPRITLAGVVEKPVDDELGAARAAHVAAVEAAKYYIDYSDFSVWVLRVQRVRWVGGYGRMDSTTAEQYAAATPDPLHPIAAGAIEHLNVDHATALAEMARALGGYPDAQSAVCTGVDRYGLDLKVNTPRGAAYTRVGFGGALVSADELRAATVELVRRARTPG